MRDGFALRTFSPPFQAAVLGSHMLSPAVRLLRLRCDDPAFSWRPGQHIEISLLRGCPAGYFYSIASAPEPTAPGEFELVLSNSASPELLAELVPGRRLRVSAAQGDFVWASVEPRASLLVGIGTGIAPLRAMLQAALNASNESVTLLFGARTESDLLFRQEFETLTRRHAAFRFEPTLSRAGAEWRGARGRVQDHLERVVRHLAPARTYACGSSAMVQTTVALLRELGIPPTSVQAESHGD
jgi:CDP-4-dehydro-6-deoxyglucose reductase